MKSKISIIIPAYNEEKTISIILDSIRKQKYENWECFVICNNCSDNTFSVSKLFENEDKRFKVFNFTWGGVSKARNTGIDLSTGELIMFFDADVYINDNYLDEVIQVYKKTDEPLIHTKMNAITNNSINVWGSDIMGKISLTDNIIFSNSKNDFGHCFSYLYKKELIGETRFNENISTGEDFLFNMEIILKNGGVYNTNIIGYNYMLCNAKLSLASPNRKEILNHFYNLEQQYGENKIFRNFLNMFLKRKYKHTICVENSDTNFHNNYSKFSSYCIKRLGQNSDIISKSDLKVQQILISPFLFFKSANIVNAFIFDDYDAIVLCETPIIDILNSFKVSPNSKPSYDTRLIGFNNEDLLEWWKKRKSDEELYEYCKQNNYRVKTMFSNIMVEEKMKMFGVQWISKDMRKKHEKDIIDFFNKK